MIRFKTLISVCLILDIEKVDEDIQAITISIYFTSKDLEKDHQEECSEIQDHFSR